MGPGELRQHLIFESYTVAVDPDSVEALVEREIRHQLNERGRVMFMRVFWELRDRGIRVSASAVDHGIDMFLKHCGCVRRLDEFDEATALFEE